MIGMRFILGAMVSFAFACSSKQEFTSNNRAPIKPKTSDGVAATPEATPEIPTPVGPAPSEQSPGGTVINSNRELMVNSFEVGVSEMKLMERSVSSAPFQSVKFGQAAVPPATMTVNLMESRNQSVPIEKRGPIAGSDTFFPNFAAADVNALPPLDVFVVIDNSEGVGTKTDPIPQRYQTALAYLFVKLEEKRFNWRVHLTTLNPSATAQGYKSIAKGSNYSAELDAFLTAAYESPASGVEPVLSSLLKVYQRNGGNMRSGAPKIFMILSEAANCKDNQGKYYSEPAVCKDKESRATDWFNYIGHADRENAVVTAIYKQTETSVCNANEPVEKLDNETLVMNSQFAELSSRFEKAAYGTVNNAALKFVSDLCAASNYEANMQAAITRTADAAVMLAKTRFLLSSNPENFPADPAYNLTLNPDAAYTRLAGGVLIKFNAEQSGRIVATYHRTNDYARTVWGFSPEPENQITLTDGAGFSTSCPKLANFDGLNSSVICRWWEGTFFLRTHMNPPIPPAGTSKNYTLSYKNKVDRLQCSDEPNKSCLTVTAPSAVLAGEVSFFKVEGNNQVKMNNYSKTVNPQNNRQITLRFNELLAYGSYQVTYGHQNLYTETIVPLPSHEPEGGRVVCYQGDARAEIGGDGNLAVQPSSSALNCQYNAGSKSVRLLGRVPADGKGENSFQIGFKASMAPVSSVVFEFPYEPGTVKVQRWSVAEDDSTSHVLESGKDFDLLSYEVKLDKPIQPGEKVRVDYKTKAVWKECYQLTAYAAGGFTYEVSYRQGNEDKHLTEEHYSLQIQESAPPKVCLLDQAATPIGGTLLVKYVTAQEKREMPAR